MNKQNLASQSFRKKVWKICSDEENVISTTQELVEQLLENREIETEKEKEDFFQPNIEDYEKELNLDGIKIAKQRIFQAIEKEELIVVFGDYDVDGLCATAVLYNGLAFLKAKVLPYIPHREKEGYGLSEEGIKQIKEKGASLVITVDNGIVAIEQAKLIKQLGIDLIITDHHIPLEDQLPEALAIVHSTNLSGAGVAWCLIKELVSEELSSDLLDLVSLATLCDLIPLTGVNRALVKAGLEKLNTTKRVGLLELIFQAGLEKGKIGAYEVGHVLGPRLNAIGRLEHSIDALRLLCTKEREKAQVLAKLLCDTNDQKKKMALQAILEAKEMVPADVHKKNLLYLYSEKWVPGIIGLVAGKVCEEYKLPVVAISKGEIYSKGSARSVNGLNIVEAIRQCSDVLLDVGGHPGAAGFTLETAKIEIFEKRLESVMENALIDKTSELKIEALIPIEKINREWVSELDKFEPFGVGNLKPVFASLNMPIFCISTVGNGQHLKFKVGGVEAIAFSFGSMSENLHERQTVDLAYYLEINRFNGNEKLQLKILDIRV